MATKKASAAKKKPAKAKATAPSKRLVARRSAPKTALATDGKHIAGMVVSFVLLSLVFLAVSIWRRG